MWGILPANLGQSDRKRQQLRSLLLGYYDDDGKLIYAGRAGSGISDAELDGYGVDSGRSRSKRCRSTSRRREGAASDRPSCCRGCIGCGRELVAEVKFLTWTQDGLL